MEKINLKEYLDVVDSLLYDFDYEQYLSEDDLDYGITLAVKELTSRFSVVTNLEIISSGGSRGVFKLTDSLVLKVNFEEELYESETRGEYGLWNLLQRDGNLSELSEYLVPILQHERRLTIMPFCKPADIEDLKEVYTICDKFEKNGIILFDVKNKIINSGKLNGKVVICDYGEWIMNKDLIKIKEKLITNEMITMNLFNTNSITGGEKNEQ